VRDLIERTAERFSSLDVLVNNAAVIGPPRFMEDADMSAWDRTMNINLNGAFYCSRKAIPIMRRQGGGKIVNIASGLGRMPFPRFCAYAVSKAGIIQLTRSLSEELKPFNIQVNAVDPGVMDTSMQEEIRRLGPFVLGETVYRNFVDYSESGGLKDPAGPASLVVFLASKAADHLSGEFGGIEDYRGMGFK
jgi:NAD(P)-dependent dehydrogenase (short-subunit alcohol dehydrogenase family)